MNIKKTLSLLILSLIYLSSYAQKCEVKADPITGVKSIQFINKQNTLRFENKETNLTDFYVTFSYTGEQNITMAKGSQVIFKLKNDKIITFESVKETVPQTRVSTSSSSVYVSTFYTFAFQLTKDEINTLASDKIVLMRYPSIDGGQLDYVVKGLGKVFASKITKGAACMSENL
jgi:hypothetical protein